MATLREEVRALSLADRALLLRVLVAELRDDATLTAHATIVCRELEIATKALGYVQTTLVAREGHAGEITERLFTRESA